MLINRSTDYDVTNVNKNIDLFVMNNKYLECFADLD